MTKCQKCGYSNGGKFIICPLCKADVLLFPGMTHAQAAQVAREIGGRVEQTDANNFRVEHGD